MTPVERPTPAPAAKSGGKASAAFQRGVQALAQWVEREGANRPPPRGHSEKIAVDGETEPTVVKLGVWTSNTRARWDKLTQEQQAALAALGMPWAKAAAVPAPSGAPAPVDDGPVQPAPSDGQAQEDHDQGDTVTEEERETQASRGRARMSRLTELMRRHTKAELLHMAYAGGLVNHNSPEKWRKDEIASAVMDIKFRAADRL
ncbi:helicase associated domain-containing protein [Streptomyces vastus]|uniref:Helicase-associated domain-containing protein n=1 Tax=Streptomyces vastus TaxID=285451 RepID=A0ABN3R5Z5_9ACTN